MPSRVRVMYRAGGASVFLGGEAIARLQRAALTNIPSQYEKLFETAKFTNLPVWKKALEYHKAMPSLLIYVWRERRGLRDKESRFKSMLRQLAQAKPRRRLSDEETRAINRREELREQFRFTPRRPEPAELDERPQPPRIGIWR